MTVNDPNLNWRFFTKVDKLPGENACWEWRGSRDSDGYGSFKLYGKTKRAHRVSYYIEHGAVPTGMSLMHVCDNPGCVRPDHLRLGTNRDNVADKVIKRRAKHGALNWNAKLTKEQVEYILASGKTQRALARELGVSKSTIGRVKRREAWL